MVFIDFSGFNLRIAKWAKIQGFRTNYYISPQIWASRENRIVKIKRDIDAMFVILPFEKEFYARCWDLNKEKKISQGSGNRYAKYLIPEGEIFEEPDPIEMLFYGIFDEDKIMRGMDMIFKYSKWSPWNEDYHSDRLIERLNKHYMHLYEGNPFIKFDTGLADLQAFVKVDGNRRILNVDDREESFYESYNGPVYLFNTNIISDNDTPGLAYQNNKDPRQKFTKRSNW